MWVKSTDLGGNMYLVDISQFDNISVDPCGDIKIDNSAQGDYYRCSCFIFKDIDKAIIAFNAIAEAIDNRAPFLDLDQIIQNR